MSTAERQQKRAYKQIKKNGQVTILNRPLRTYNPVEGTQEISDVYQTNVAVVNLPNSGKLSQGYETSFKNELVLGRARFFYFAGKDMEFVPLPNDLLLYEYAFWELVGITQLAPDPKTPLLYVVGARQSQITSIDTDTDPPPPSVPGAQVGFSWQHYVLRYQPSNTWAIAGGTIRQYNSDFEVVYRFEPNPYDYSTDAFYREFDGSTYSDLIVTRI